MATPTPPTLPLTVSRSIDGALVPQLTRQLRELVRSGALPAAVRLPSIRAMAGELGISRVLVEQAYSQLIAEGWLTGRRGSGTYVAEVGERLGGVRRQASAVAGQGSVHGTPRQAEPERLRLDTGTPYIDPRYDAGWRRAWRDVSASRMPRGYPDAAGLAELRVEIAGHLVRTRGLSCGADEVMITSGATHGLGLVLDALDAGAVAVEDPGYRAAVAAALAAGRRVIDVGIDAQGLDVDGLRLESAAVRAVYVTPAHQHPLGITMSAGRRLALLDEATRRGALVVEDDYDSEFRYDVAPLPALAALDRAGDRVVYLGSASKSVHPGLRIGWLVASRALVEEIAVRRTARHDHPPWPMQRAFLSMLRDGHVARLVRSARRVYAERIRLVDAALSPYGTIGSPPAGMYLTLSLPGSVADSVRAACWAAGYDVPSLADYSRSSGLTGLVVGFGGLTDSEFARALAVLTRALARAEIPCSLRGE